MEPQPREVHILGLIRRVKPRQYQPEPLGVLSLLPGFASGRIKNFQPLVSEALYHMAIVTSSVTVCKNYLPLLL